MVEISLLYKDTDKFAVDKDKKIHKMKLLIKDETAEFLNSLKRTIEEDVKVLSIEDVYIIDNDSPMWDEMLAHRLGLIVLNTPENIKENQEIKLYLEKDTKGYIYASDIKSDNKDVYPIYPETIIDYIEEGQKVKLEAIAILGNGRKHTKFVPAYVYYYRNATLKLEGDLEKKEIENLGLLNVSIKKGKIVVPKDKEYDRNFMDSIESASKGKIKVIPKNEFVFVLESYGQYSAEKIIIYALDEMEIKLRNLLNQLINN
ncbi:DNA-directed RNA polymerase subunit D [Nanobdella aerobiophila]|uniref:DNA-directed RNA polymerase subunit Rpo3 n=1 Tax=Nanobdella aerobiophila TaxID=2586965 RepID=A0A915WSV7_9ARCH|nr:DNA-directed RNA polymerase subunit D [Nanobdella aerobiophila]BBL45700.1 DNA-directed RNA polymerase subunit D [Nanobdella aerobiophila]